MAPACARIASGWRPIPGAGPYVDAVLPPDVVRVGPAGGPGPWLDAAYLAEHAAEIDVLHLHTGSGRVTDAAVQCWSETVRRSGLPLVVTVHRVRSAASLGTRRAGATPRTPTSRRSWARPRWCSP